MACVFIEIPASLGGHPRRSFVFTNIPASFLQKEDFLNQSKMTFERVKASSLMPFGGRVDCLTKGTLERSAGVRESKHNPVKNSRLLPVGRQATRSPEERGRVGVGLALLSK